MGWVSEDLAGTKDGANKSFTITSTPLLQSLSIFHQGTRIRRVAAMPGDKQYAISGTSVTMGEAPQSTDDLWTRYFTEV